jgi:2-methylcitrate dehydratase PrpD
MLMSRGFTADPEILDAPLGFLAALTLSGEANTAQVLEQLGKPYVLDDTPKIKPYPTCTPAQPVLDARLAMRQQEGISVDDVESIETFLAPFSLFRSKAVDEASAGFCSSYLFAAALVHGRLGLDQTSDEAVLDTRVQTLATKVKEGEKGQVTVRLRGNRVLKRELKPVRRLTPSRKSARSFAIALSGALRTECRRKLKI